MFSTKLFLSLLAISASALAAPSLSLKVSGADAAEGVENLKVVTTLTNTGDSTLKLLKDPRTALSNISTDSFSISSKTGKSPSFSGIRAKYVPSEIVKRNSDSSFVVLAPGESIDIEHELASAYDFTKSGADTYEIKSSNLFRYVDESSEVKEIYADATSSHAAKLTGKLAAAKRNVGFAKRATTDLGKRIGFNGCSSDQESALKTSAEDANAYAAESVNYLRAIDSSTDRYTTWFGEYADTRYDAVLNHYAAISEKNFDDYSYDCDCAAGDDDTYAYVYPDNFGTIYICPAFWRAENTGSNSRAGTLIHESSHFDNIAGTQDYVYGEADAQQLARNDPEQAIQNADNHEYFSENPSDLP